MTPRLIGYARVSTVDQNPALQLAALEAEGCAPIYTEHVSGAAESRPVLDAALEACRPGDTLCVWKLDRLGRSLLHVLETVEHLRHRDIDFRSITESLDTKTPHGRVLFAITGAFAEFERGLIRERTLAGLKRAKEEGKVLGRPTTVDHATLEKAMASDLSPWATAKALGVPYRPLLRALQRQKTLREEPEQHDPSTDRPHAHDGR